MEDLTELPTQASFLLLNEDCLLKLFDYLEFEDSMNLAETCTYLSAVANIKFSKYSKMKVDENSKKCIFRFFTRFGHHVLSLICHDWRPLGWRTVNNCKNLKRLEMSGISGNFENDQPLFTIDDLEALSFAVCDEGFVKSFLNIVRKVKALSIRWCQIKCNVLTTVFTNSLDMECFEWCNFEDGFDFHLLEMISNVERLSLYVELKNASELDPLLKLNRLSKLKLLLNVSCRPKNITSFLRELAKKGIIQELELTTTNDAFDENFFERLKSFDSLKLLILRHGHSSKGELKSSIFWPPQLKCFQFIRFEFTLDAFLATIKQLKYLESICFKGCWIAEGEEIFYNVKRLSQQILDAIADCDRKQRLNVVLPTELQFEEGSSEKFIYDSEELTIYNSSYNPNPLEIGINFPFKM